MLRVYRLPGYDTKLGNAPERFLLQRNRKATEMHIPWGRFELGKIINLNLICLLNQVDSASRNNNYKESDINDVGMSTDWKIIVLGSVHEPGSPRAEPLSWSAGKICAWIKLVRVGPPVAAAWWKAPFYRPWRTISNPARPGSQTEAHSTRSCAAKGVIHWRKWLLWGEESWQYILLRFQPHCPQYPPSNLQEFLDPELSTQHGIA